MKANDDAAVFWQWFPLGRAGVRTILLFMSVLAVFILRIAQLHSELSLAVLGNVANVHTVGARSTSSPFRTFLQYILSSGFDVIQSLLCYTFSAWLFGEVYIWSTSTGVKLSMVDTGK